MTAAVPTAFVDVHGLEPDAVRVVEAIVQRLRLGQERYGKLDLSTNPRDWRAEAEEEFLDGAIYLAMQSVKAEGARHAPHVAGSTSSTEARLFRAYCSPAELVWLTEEMPRLQALVRSAEADGNVNIARAVALEILKGKRDLIEAVQKRMDGGDA